MHLSTLDLKQLNIQHDLNLLRNYAVDLHLGNPDLKRWNVLVMAHHFHLQVHNTPYRATGPACPMLMLQNAYLYLSQDQQVQHPPILHSAHLKML